MWPVITEHHRWRFSTSKAEALKVKLADRVKQDTPGVLEHAEGWRISSQPTKVESNRQGQRSPETASDQSSPAASRQSPIRPVSGLGSRDSRPSATRPRAARATSGRRWTSSRLAHGA